MIKSRIQLLKVLGIILMNDSNNNCWCLGHSIGSGVSSPRGGQVGSGDGLATLRPATNSRAAKPRAASVSAGADTAVAAFRPHRHQYWLQAALPTRFETECSRFLRSMTESLKPGLTEVDHMNSRAPWSRQETSSLSAPDVQYFPLLLKNTASSSGTSRLSFKAQYVAWSHRSTLIFRPGLSIHRDSRLNKFSFLSLPVSVGRYGHTLP